MISSFDNFALKGSESGICLIWFAIPLPIPAPIAIDKESLFTIQESFPAVFVLPEPQLTELMIRAAAPNPKNNFFII